MGLNGMLLKEKELMDFNKLISDIKIAALKSNIICTEGIEYEIQDHGIYLYKTYILKDKIENTENEFLLYTFNDLNEMVKGTFSFIDKNKDYQQCINIENFFSCKMLLNFIYEYLLLNPFDVFFNEMEWYYKFDDIKEIVGQQTFDSNWCYKKPN